MVDLVGTQAKPSKIDIHHHIFPPEHIYPKNELNIQRGWTTPAGNLPWTPQKSLEAMDKLDIELAVLSYPADVPFKQEHPKESHGDRKTQAREMNEYAHKICEQGNGRFGWMACLGDLRNTDMALEELAYALDTLGADGISLSSSYGQGQEALYIGDDTFDLVWKELNRRGATVFLHGAQIPSSTPYPHPFLGIPITEVPNETFKAAAHLVVTGKKRRFSRVKIILAHLGGSAPFLAPRVAVLSAHMGCTMSPEECIDDFSSFYFDTSLSSHRSTLGMDVMRPERLLFGTDFPAVSTDMAAWYAGNVDEYYAHDIGSLGAVTRGNALKLFPQLRRKIAARASTRKEMIVSQGSVLEGVVTERIGVQ